LAYARKDPFPLVLPLTVVFIWSFLKGTRNILLHQLSDRRNDRISGLRTFVIRYGPLGTVNLLNRIFIPLESFFLTVLVIGISFYISGFYLVFIGFLIFSMLKIRIWSISWMPRRQWRFLFWYSLNDFYEEWIPVSFLVWLSVRDPLFLILLAAHLLLFPRVFYKMAKELKEMNHDWLIYYERNVGQVILEQTWKAMVFLGTSFAWPFQWFYWHALRPFWLYIFRTPIRLRRFFIQINRKWFGGNLIVYFSLIRGHFTGRPMDEEGWGKLETRRFVIRDTDISEVVPEELDRMIRRARAVQFISEEDPFRVEAFYPLWEYMIRIKRSCLIEVSTSALELDERARHIIGKGLFRITVPLETLQKERFEKLHPESDHERFMEHLAFLESYSRKENIPLHLQIALTRDNWKEWPDMVDFCSRMRAFVRFGGDTGSQGNPSLAFTDHETGCIRDFLKQNLPVGKGLFAGINRKEYQRFINNL
jgi:4-hydroxybenzoate polyprenyltransferase